MKSMVLLIVAVAWFLPLTAMGQVSVAIVEISLQGDLDPLLVDRVAETLGTGLQAAGVPAVSPEVVAERLWQAGLTPGCAAGDCMSQAGALTDCEVLLRAVVEQDEAGTTFSTELFLASTGERLTEHRIVCEGCSWSEVLQRSNEQVQRLTAALPGAVRLDISPSQARVSIGGRVVSWEEPVFLVAGAHEVEVSSTGYETSTTLFTVEANQTVDVSLHLEPRREEQAETPAASVETGRRSRLDRLTVWGIVTAGVAVAGLVPGLVWLGIDGTCAPSSPRNGDGVCRDLYDTWREGAALTILGGAAAVVSLVLFLVRSSHRRARQRESGVQVSSSPVLFTTEVVRR